MELVEERAEPAFLRSGIAALLLHLAIAIAIERMPRGSSRALPLVVPLGLDVDLASTAPPVPVRLPPPSTAPSVAHTAAPAPPRRAAPTVHREQRASKNDDDTVPNGQAADSKGGAMSGDGQDGDGNSPRGVPSATGTGSAPPAPLPRTPLPVVDRSRPAMVRRAHQWDCPWPVEGDADQIDEAYVLITVHVDASGRATRVDMTDPGHGFGREAQRCALRETYTPGTDRDGRLTATMTKPFRVHFAR